MVETSKATRELAARALCVQFGFDPDADSAGQPTWQTYLPAADAVLEAIGWIEPDPDRPPLRIMARGEP